MCLCLGVPCVLGALAVGLPGLRTAEVHTILFNPLCSEAGPVTVPVSQRQKQTERGRAAEPGFVLIYFVFGGIT